MSKLLKWLILPCTLTLFPACSDDTEKEEDANTETPQDISRRTVLMYVSAQNSLGYNNFHDADSMELVNGRKFIDDNDRMLVFVDDEKSPRMYRYTKNAKQPELIRTWNTDVNSASPETLEDVLSWTKEHYPSKEYGLVMWSHSDGWLPSTNKQYTSRSSQFQTYSFGIDVGAGGSMMYDQDQSGKPGAQMDIDDMAKAIQNSGIHFQYIFFDSCLMQTLESGFSLRNVTDYIIAGPMQIPGCGANYTHMLKKGLFTKAEYDIVDTYYTDAEEGFDDFDNEYYDFGVVITSIRTDKLEALAKTTAEVLPRSKATGRKSADLSGVLNYQTYCYAYYYRPHHYDAQEAMRKLLDEKDFKKYQAALNDVIVSKHATEKFWIGPNNNTMQRVDLQHYCGIAAFVPQQVYTTNATDCIYGDLNQTFSTTSWYKAAGWDQTGW